mgnify:CR=1 FL=1
MPDRAQDKNSLIRHAVECFQRDLSSFHFLQAAGVAGAIASISSDLRQECEDVREFLVSYHGRIVGTLPLEYPSSPTQVAERIQNELVSPDRALDKISVERSRIVKLFQRAHSSTEDSLVLQFFLAYYALVNQDGLRASVWLGHALRFSSRICALPHDKEDLSQYLCDVSIASLKQSSSGNEGVTRLTPTRSLYVSCQNIADYMSTLLDRKVFDLIEKFKPRADIIPTGSGS